VHERSAASAERPQSAPRSLGILGGTFNPPHLGHLAVARHALAELALDQVLLVPAHTAPNKSDAEAGSWDPGPEHRLRMCELAVAAEPMLAVCPVEIERGGLSYTVDTLRSIHASNPDAQLTLIVGADTAATISSWREPAQLLELAQLAVAARVGAARQRVLDALAAISDAGADVGIVRKAVRGVRFLEMPVIEASSSLARQRVAAGEAVKDLVGPAVARYIAEHDLYESAVASR
jgi:nicotinate-nucleotide adenylyltransferase